MKEKYERHCASCDTVNRQERTECYRCGHRTFVRYRLVPVEEDAKTQSGPVAERREF